MLSVMTIHMELHTYVQGITITNTVGILRSSFGHFSSSLADSITRKLCLGAQITPSRVKKRNISRSAIRTRMFKVKGLF